jgi:hypothetical protein
MLGARDVAPYGVRKVNLLPHLTYIVNHYEIIFAIVAK